MIARFPLLVWRDQFKTAVLARRERAGANRGNGGRKENLCSLRFLLLQSKRDGDADFVFLACRDTASLGAPKSDEGRPYINNFACLPSIALAAEGANTKPSMS